MSGKNKPGRPKKEPVEPPKDRRAKDMLEASFHLVRLGFDPKNEDPTLADFLAHASIMQDLHEWHQELQMDGKVQQLLWLKECERMSDFFLPLITKVSADEAEHVFRKIVRFLRNRDANQNRNFDLRVLAYRAYMAFSVEVGEAPNRAKLKNYILRNPYLSPQFPKSNETQAWDRIWKGSGLKGLADSKGPKHS